MTSKERLLLALQRKETDRLPYAPLADNYFAASLPKQGFKYDLVEALKYIGCDIMLRHGPAYLPVYKCSVSVDTIEKEGKFETHYKTPVGEIYNRFYFENGTMFMQKHLLETIEDVKIMTYVAENTDFTPTFDAFYESEKNLGDFGIWTPDVPCSPLMDTLQVLCGLENTSFFMVDEPEIMEAMFNALHERNKKVCRILCDLNFPAAFSYEDTSTTIMSKYWLTEYAIPALNDYANILHAAGKTYITHMCGKLSGFKTEIADVLADGIDSVCPPTTGDLALPDAQKAFPSKILIGGIEPPSLVLQPRDTILRNVFQIINQIPDKSGIILSTGDAVPFGAPVETLKAIADLIRHFGRRSLEGNISQDEIEKYLSSLQ